MKQLGEKRGESHRTISTLTDLPSIFTHTLKNKEQRKETKTERQEREARRHETAMREERIKPQNANTLTPTDLPFILTHTLKK